MALRLDEFGVVTPHVEIAVLDVRQLAVLDASHTARGAALGIPGGPHSRFDRRERLEPCTRPKLAAVAPSAPRSKSI